MATNTNPATSSSSSQLFSSSTGGVGNFPFSTPSPSTVAVNGQPQPPQTSNRPPAPKLIIKLTHKLMETYNSINEKYYANKKKRALEAKNAAAAAAGSTNSASSSSSTAVSSTVYNDGHDDKDYNYIVRSNEKLNNRYLVEHSLGKGSFGRVVKCLDLLTGRHVAVKIIKSKSAFYKQAQIELKLLASLQVDCESNNIVAMLDNFMHHNHQCIVFELLSINLYDLLRNTRFQGVSLNLIAKFAHQILFTLDYLSSPDRGEKRVIHSDLKPENILLVNPKKSMIRIIDFGSACFANQKAYTYIQSRFYRAPEVLLNLPYSGAIDMWSLGCILVELHTGHPLFDGQDEADQVTKQCEVLGIPPVEMLENNRKAEKYFERNEINEWTLKRKYKTHKFSSLRLALGSKYVCNVMYEQFLDLVGSMLQYNPKNRIRPSVALAHPFFTTIFGQNKTTSESPNPAGNSASPTNNSVAMESSSSAALKATVAESSEAASVSTAAAAAVPMETQGDSPPYEKSAEAVPASLVVSNSPAASLSSGKLHGETEKNEKNPSPVTNNAADSTMIVAAEENQQINAQNPKKRPHSNPLHVPTHILQAGAVPADHSILLQSNNPQSTYFNLSSQQSSGNSSLTHSQAATPRKNSFGSSRDASQPKTGSLGRGPNLIGESNSPVNSISSRVVQTNESDSDADYSSRGDWENSGLAFSPAAVPRSGSMQSNQNFPRLEGSGSFSNNGPNNGLNLGSSTSSSANNSCRSSPSVNNSSLVANKNAYSSADQSSASTYAELPMSSDPTALALAAWRRRKGAHEAANNSSPLSHTPTQDDEADYSSAADSHSNSNSHAPHVNGPVMEAWVTDAKLKLAAAGGNKSAAGTDSPARAHFSRMSINEELGDEANTNRNKSQK